MNDMEFYADKRVLITGGAGTIGTEIVKKLSEYGKTTITVMSRDETKQAELARVANHKNIRCVIGDVRDRSIVGYVVQGHDVVIHAAAMKHVDKCNENPAESIRTNLLGAINVQEAVAASNVDVCVVVSTDKAANPFGVMGLTKKLQEQLFLYGYNGRARVCITRFGNVLGSRGSVAPYFRKLIVQKKKIEVTDPSMIRFYMTPQQAAELVLYAGSRSRDLTITVRKMQYATVKTLAAALGATKDMIDIVGVRPGEKMEEQLLDEDEMKRTYIHDLTRTPLKATIGVIMPARSEGSFHADHVRATLGQTPTGVMLIDEMRSMLIESGVMTE